MRKVLTFVVLAVLCGAASLGGEAKFPPEAGKLNLPLVVTDYSGVNRPGEVVTGGVPMPRGLVRDLSRLRVVDAQGRPVPCRPAP